MKQGKAARRSRWKIKAKGSLAVAALAAGVLPAVGQEAAPHATQTQEPEVATNPQAAEAQPPEAVDPLVKQIEAVSNVEQAETVAKQVEALIEAWEQAEVEVDKQPREDRLRRISQGLWKTGNGLSEPDRVRDEREAGLRLLNLELQLCLALDGEQNPETLNSLNNYGYALRSFGRSAEAEPYFKRAMEGRLEVLGDRHPDTLGSLNNYGYVLDSLGRDAEAG